jgi:hypothetical protein
MLPYFPFGVIVALLLWFFQFKLDVFDLRNFKVYLYVCVRVCLSEYVCMLACTNECMWE